MEKLAPPVKWAAYNGSDNVTHFIFLPHVVGIKYDEITKEVVLRMDNGHFVTTTESIGKVLADLNALG